MGFLNPCHKCEEEVQWLRHLVDVQAQTILNLSKPKPANSVKLILTFNNNSKSKNMGLTLNPNQTVVGQLSLIDLKTGNPVVATFANVSVVSDNPAAVTAALGSDGVSIVATAIAAGSANITATADASYTDSNGQAQVATQIFAAAVAVSVAQPTADQVGLVLTFGTPTP